MTTYGEYSRRIRQQQKEYEEKEQATAYNEVDREFRKQPYWHGAHVYAGFGEGPKPGPQEGWVEVAPGKYRWKRPD